MNLTELRDIKALLARHGFRFSKSMGQNFLIADWVPRDIAEAAGLDETCAVLEIGPGIGPLPGGLPQRGGDPRGRYEAGSGRAGGGEIPRPDRQGLRQPAL